MTSAVKALRAAQAGETMALVHTGTRGRGYVAAQWSRFMVRSALAAVLGGSLVGAVAAPAWSVPQSVTMSDPVDARPVISGSPDPDVSALSVTQDGSTVSVTLNFHGPALASPSSHIYSTLFRLGVGTAKRLTPSDPNSSSICSTAANLNVSFASGSPSGTFTVSGAAGSLPFTSGPTFNADRTQLTWSMTHSSLATPMDCVEAGPLIGYEYSYASNPDSYYNANCSCWLDPFDLDRFAGDDHGLGSDIWFPGKTPPPSLNSGFSGIGPFAAGTPINFSVYAYGVAGSSRTAVVKWFQGGTLAQSNTGLVVAGGANVTFSYTPPAAGTYRVELSHDGGLAVTKTFNVGPGPYQPPPPPPTAPAAAPFRMKAPKAVSSDRNVVVRWKAANNNGSAITRYIVDISKGKSKSAGSSARRAVFKNLAPGRYRVRVAAKNAIGRSPFSAWTVVRVR